MSKLGTGALTIRDSSITDNTAPADGAGLVAYGGGVYVAEGELLLERVTLARNSAIAANGASQARGGAIELGNDAGPATLRNVTVSGNEAAGPTSMGGGISNFALLAGSSVVLEHVTIAGNRATGGGAGGGLVGAVTTSVVDSVIAGNSASVARTRLLHPRGAVDPRCGRQPDRRRLQPRRWAAARRSPARPLLGPLQLNGPGGTETMELAAGSPALDATPTSGGRRLPAARDRPARQSPVRRAAPATSAPTRRGRRPRSRPRTTSTSAAKIRATARRRRRRSRSPTTPAPTSTCRSARPASAALTPTSSSSTRAAARRRWRPASRAGSRPASTCRAPARRTRASTSRPLGGDLHSPLNGYAPPAVMTVTNPTDYGAGRLRDAIEQVGERAERSPSPTG